MRLVRSEVPGFRRAYGNAWTRRIGEEMLRTLRMNPGQTFQLADGEKAVVLHTSEVVAMMATAPRPYRVITRRAPGGKKTDRHVWVSFDPGHWERWEQAKRKKEEESN